MNPQFLRDGILKTEEYASGLAVKIEVIIRIMATGVIHARMFVCNAVAPVRNGDSCAKLSVGTANKEADSQRMHPGVDLERAVDIMMRGLRDRLGTMSPETRSASQRT